eukprot:2038477-Alexandrium_andersonii.AAC.1
MHVREAAEEVGEPTVPTTPNPIVKMGRLEPQRKGRGAPTRKSPHPTSREGLEERLGARDNPRDLLPLPETGAPLAWQSMPRGSNATREWLPSRRRRWRRRRRMEAGHT